MVISLAAPAFRNVVLVIADALRKDRVREEVTPYLHSLARKGVWFENAYTTINATDPSLTSIYTGRYPSSHGLIHHGKQVSDEEWRGLSSTRFLQEVLHDSSFFTGAVDILERWHKRGFERYVIPGGRAKSIISWVSKRLPASLRPFLRKIVRRGRSGGYSLPYTAEEATKAAEELVEHALKEGRRFFLLIHYWDTHVPYRVPARKGSGGGDSELYRCGPLAKCLEGVKGPWRRKLIEMFGEDTPTSVIASMYDAGARAVDNAIKELIGFFEGKGLLSDTVFIITSDHGESLGEHGIWFDHHGLYEVSVRTPLIIFSESIESIRVTFPVQNIDLMPTIASLLGIKHSVPGVEGLDLAPYVLGNEEPGETLNKRPIYLEEAYTERKLAIILDGMKYIMAPDREKAVCRYCGIIHGGLEELYDLRRDPREELNIIEESNEEAKRLRQALLRYIRRAGIRRGLAKSIWGTINKRDRDIVG